MAKKFKAKEKKAGYEWEGEEITAQSKTNIEDDKGTGQAVVLRFFDFGANPVAFKKEKPTAQQLFNSHLRGMESLLWKDGLKVYSAVQPRLMFSKDKTRYRFVIPAISDGTTLMTQTPQTLSQILHEKKAN